MKRNVAYMSVAIIFGCMLLYTASIYGALPERVPIHWNIRGEADGWASKQTAVMIMPLMVVFLTALIAGLPIITPKQFQAETRGDSYNYIMVVVIAMMAYIHLLILRAGLNPHMDMNRSLFTGMFLFFGLLGNMMGKIRRNPWMGVKTPWTLASDRVWEPTHRLAGRLMVASGLLGAVLTLAGISPIPGFVIFTAACLYPLPYSYMLYKRLERSGGL